MDTKQIKQELEKIVAADVENSFIQKYQLRQPENEKTKHEYRKMDVLFAQEAYLENLLQNAPTDASPETHQEVILLAIDVYSKIADELRLWANSEYSWSGESALGKKFRKGSYSYNLKYNDCKKKINHPTVLKTLRYQEALTYEQDNRKKLDMSDKHNCDRFCVEAAGRLWAIAGETEKAINYFNQGGPYSYPVAAATFERVGDRKNARAFWIKAAEDPQGYSDEVDVTAAGYWLTVGNLEKALARYERAMNYWISQDGSIDLHGEEKPGRAEAESLRKQVVEPLKQRLKQKQKKARK